MGTKSSDSVKMGSIRSMLEAVPTTIPSRHNSSKGASSRNGSAKVGAIN